MKTMLTSLLLALALVFSPGVARAGNSVPATSAAATPAELGLNEIDVTGVALTGVNGLFTGKLKVKAFVHVNGVLKVKVKLKGILKVDLAEHLIELDDVLIAVGDIDVSCARLKIALVSIKVKVKLVVLGVELDVFLRINEAELALDASTCDWKKLCRLAFHIHGKKNCFVVVKLLNELFGFCGKDGKYCGDGHHDDDDDHDHDCDDDHDDDDCKGKGKGKGKHCKDD